MTDENEPDYEPGIDIGAAQITCPECGQVIPIRVRAQLGLREDGRQTLITDPDMTDLWAHAWSHESDDWVRKEYDQ